MEADVALNMAGWCIASLLADGEKVEADAVLNMAGWRIASLLADGEKVEADAAMEMEELAPRQSVGGRPRAWRLIGA